MPRGKKAAKELSPEEKLEQALVPDWEQPYKVPENWCWARIGALSSLHRGVTYKKNDAHIIKKADDCLIMRGGNVGEGYITIDADNVYVSKTLVDDIQLIRQNDIIIVASTGSSKVIGRAGIAVTNYEDVSFGAFLMLVRPVDKFNPKYLGLFFQSDDYRNQIRYLANGVNINNIRADHINDMPIPVPPLIEQRRIVSRIGSLFAKLDEAKEKAQAVVEGFELRKSALLHKAFTGELTERWRKEHGVRTDSWTERNIQSVCAMKITDGTHKTPTYCEKGEGIPFISAKDVTSGKICWDNIKYIIPELHEELYQRLAPQLDDVLLAKNGTTGVAAIVEEEKIFDLYVTLAVLRPDKEVILPRYLLNIINSPICKRQFDEHLTGIGVPNLHLRDIKEVLIAVPSLEEQAEVVRIVDKLMENEQRAKEAAEAVLDLIDTMKKAILARAFRGKLGTNDPAEEWAGELVKKIL